MFSVGASQQAVPCFSTDVAFNRLYPLPFQMLAVRHWSPLRIIKKAVEFLTPHPSVRILDIGSGIGKFCIAGAYYKPDALFTGIEQRSMLVNLANNTASNLGINNVHFINDNFTRLDFREYDHFYFYNSFYENLSGTDKIDNSIEYTAELYYYYCRYLNKKLEEMPAGTRLVTFHSLENEIPLSYKLQEIHFEKTLKYWIKS
jgi:SAM-dependent methyltransferase